MLFSAGIHTGRNRHETGKIFAGFEGSLVVQVKSSLLSSNYFIGLNFSLSGHIVTRHISFLDITLMVLVKEMAKA